MMLRASEERPTGVSARFEKLLAMSGQLVFVGQQIHKRALVAIRLVQEQPMRVPRMLWDELGVKK
jgi:hypothetical protein